MKKTLALAALAATALTLPACSRSSDTDNASLGAPALTNDDFSSGQENAGALDDGGNLALDNAADPALADNTLDNAAGGNTL